MAKPSRSCAGPLGLSLEQGRELVSVARSTIEKYLGGSPSVRHGESGQIKKFEKEFENNFKKKFKKLFEKLSERRAGVFVTLHTFPERELRGCIGFVSPMPLLDGVQRAAHAAAFEDPRFPPLGADELGKTIIEISILSEPVPIKCGPEDYEKNIDIGEDGLILQNGPYSGLFLPQVPVEQNWGAEEYLRNLCYKAGLTPEFLHDRNTELWKFQAQVFAEKEPGGEVEEVKIEKSK